MLYSILVSIDVLIAASLIGLVLLQQGKGASAGAAFGGGGGASGTVFGAKGSSSFMSRGTALLAAGFFINSIVLAYLASNRPVAESIMDSSVVQEQQVDMPASDMPNVINLPEGTSSEEMLDLKSEVEKQSQQASDVPVMADDAKQMMSKKVEQTMPANIPK